MTTTQLLQVLITLDQQLEQTPLTPAERQKFKGRWHRGMHLMGEKAAEYREILADWLDCIPYSAHDIRRALQAVLDADRTYDLAKVFLKAAADTKIARRSQAYAMIMGVLYEIQAHALRPSLDDHERTRLTRALNSLREWLDRRNRKIGRARSALQGHGKRHRLRFLGVALDWPKGGVVRPYDREGRTLSFSTLIYGHWPVSPSHLARQALSPRTSQSLPTALSPQPAAALRTPAAGPVTGPRTLRELREERGLTQLTLARTAGLTQAMLSRTETRNDHLLSTLRKYAGALGATLEVALVFPGGRRVPLRSAV